MADARYDRPSLVEGSRGELLAHAVRPWCPCGQMRAFAAGLLVFFATPALAGGFYVPEIGARATGMAGAVTASGEDASALIHNPAAMVLQDKLQIQLGSALAFPVINFFRQPVVDPITDESITFAGVGNTNTLSAIPYLAATSSLLDGDLALGLGLHVPFGAHLTYPEDGAQRHVATEIELKAIHVSAGAGYKLTRRLSVGLSLSYIFSDLVIGQKNALQFVTGDPEQFPDPDAAVEGTTHLEAKDSFSLGGKLGLLYAGDNFSIGAAVTAPVTLGLKGKAQISNGLITPLNDDDGNELQSAGLRADDIRIEMPLPLIVSAGVLVQPATWLAIELDVTWQRWSTFETLTVDFVNEHSLLPTPGAFLYDVQLDNSWSDTLSARIGVEAKVFDGLRVRGGALYDESPIDDRHFDILAPDADKAGLSVGAGYRFELGGLELDAEVAFLHLFFAERSIEAGSVNVAGTMTPIPPTDRTIQNKSAPSFFSGVTRARVELAYLSLGVCL